MANEKIFVSLPTPSIMGIKTIEHRNNGDIIETRTGHFTHKYVDCFYVVVEDELAKRVIESVACDCGHLPMKFIFSGAWGNQAACLFGFLLYAEKLKGSNIPPFSIIAIDDGDISIKSKEKRIDGLLKGNFIGAELKNLRDNLSNLLLSFNLEYLDENIKKGIPEYNHKKWFEEITKEMIIKVDQPSNHYEYGQLESCLEIIEFSKGIELEDYHNYYEELSKCSPRNTIHTFHDVKYFVLNSIKKYNPIKWEQYTGHIKKALVDLDAKNRENFIASNVYLER